MAPLLLGIIILHIIPFLDGLVKRDCVDAVRDGNVRGEESALFP